MISQLKFGLAVGLVIILPGCYFDNVEELYPNSGNCDTTAVTYALTIAPILQNYCNTCHGNTSAAAAGAGIYLEGHTHVSTYITAHPTLFLDAIQHTGTATPMPLGGGALSSCNLTQIKKWIQAGMPNN